MLRAFEMAVRARARSGDPAARSVGHRDMTVERSRELERHEGPVLGLTDPPRRHRGARFGGEDVQDDLHPCGLQPRYALAVGARIRSEAHTSEPQSLMRTSYAVF